MAIPRSAVAVIGGALVAGCVEASPELEPTAAVSFFLGPSAFDGMSIKFVSANRAVPADAKYHCNNSLPPNSCFALSATAPVTFDDLCPSTNIPNGGWNFSYELYSSADCSGNPLTNSTIKCFDSHDLFSQSHPNQTFDESLQPGANHNAIACIPPAGEFCTYTQGAYHATCNNGNPPSACLLQDHFGGSFPSGLFIGQGVTWTDPSPNDGTAATFDGPPLFAAGWLTSEAVKEFVGGGGTPGVLTEDLPNSPPSTPAGNFATQLVTTTLNVKFNLDNWLVGTDTTTKLADLIAVGGCQVDGETMPAALDGRSVREILQLAERTISDETTGFTPSALTEALDVINKNFDNCNSNRGCLRR